MTALRAEGLVKRFGALLVTDHVDLDLRDGEVHALIGPNGAGKTTLIKQLSGALAPDQGRILIDGEDVTALSQHARAARGLGRSFQITSVFAGLSARENVMLAAQAKTRRPARLFRDAGEDRRLAEAAEASLAEVGLSNRVEVDAGVLAHGERRSLELAMALAQRPKLLLLDEPMAGTGREETERMVALLAGLKRRVPMLLVEHDMSAVFALADRVSVLVAGRVIASGAPETVRADPVVRAAYLGEAA